ncbi:MAG TPA: pentapeptide repeat-containing protein, partial [Stellaceae bacterium]
MRLLPIGIALLIATASARAADVTVQQISVALAKASPSSPVNFSHRDLSYLDLSELDFKHANLGGANLYGADLSRADLSRVNLSGANLDHTLIIGANFAGADLSNASLFDTVGYSSLEVSPAEAPNFSGANL